MSVALLRFLTGKHARRHAHVIGHPIVQAYDPPDDWRWCYFDETYI